MITIVKPDLKGRTSNDRNCCTVDALSGVTGLPWQEAQRMAASAGRRTNKGFYSHRLIEHYNTAAVHEHFRPVAAAAGMTLGAFLRCYPRGKFYTCKSRHAFAVVDGKVQDFGHLGARTRIRRAWQLVDSTSPAVAAPVVAVETAATFNREQFIAEWYATGRPTSKKIPCTRTGRMITCYSTNLQAKVRKYGSVEALLNNFVSRGAR